MSTKGGGFNFPVNCTGMFLIIAPVNNKKASNLNQKKEIQFFAKKKVAPNWARTSDLSVNSRALYHLSHKSISSGILI